MKKRRFAFCFCSAYNANRLIIGKLRYRSAEIRVAPLMAQTPPQIFNSTRWRQNRDRAAKSGFAQAAFLKELACTRLAERLDLVKRDFSDILDLGCHSGQMGAALPARFHQHPLRLTQTDASDCFVQQAATANPFAQNSIVMTDELLPVEQASCDAVLSSLYLHWMNDLPGMFTQIRLALRPDGLFLAVLLGGRSLSELRGCLAAAETELCGGLSPRVTPMADIRDLGSLLQRAGFALPVADAEMLTITYPDMFRMMADLRAMGGQNCLVGRVGHFTSRAVFLRAAELYQQKYSDEAGHITASVELITLTGWAPDANQPKPLRPGSAAQRLADVLETTEVGLKDS